jgi:DNA-binding beta-propeller fold protein YncE
MRDDSGPVVETLRRVPCVHCQRAILEGARKCKHCKKWQPERPRAPRAAIVMLTTVLSVFSVIATSHRTTTIEKAPPLTQLAGDAASSSSATPPEPSPASVGPEQPRPEPPKPAKREWRARELQVADGRPLDLAFSKSGESLFVSGDDATLRELRVDTGEMLHKASTPAKGDRLRLLFGRYAALIPLDPRVARIPVLDITKWDRDPMLLDVGLGPADIVELPDGSVVASTTEAHRVTRFAMPSGRPLGDLVLPQSTGQVFVLRAEGRTQLAAVGRLAHAGRPAGAWLDVFDPDESPFGATRRSVAVGREPRTGSATTAGNALFLPDFASHAATLVDLSNASGKVSVDVGQGPIAAFVLAEDRWAVTLDALGRTATIVDLRQRTPNGGLATRTLMLPGEPRSGALSPDRRALFVAMGGTEDPPRGQGVVVIAGDPPEVVHQAPTGSGAMAVAVSPNGARAAVANYLSKTITILE